MALRYSLLPALGIGLFCASFFALPASASAATLWVYVQVYDARDRYQPSDFTIEVSGRYPSPTSFLGTAGGRKVDLDEGHYAVVVRDTRGYRLQHSPGCAGFIYRHQTIHCTVTLTSPSYYYPPYYQQPYYPPQQPYYQPQPQPYYSPSITVQKGYVPGLPSTGFPPLSPFSLSLATAMLLVAGFFLYPYGRKAFTAILR